LALLRSVIAYHFLLFFSRKQWKVRLLLHFIEMQTIVVIFISTKFIVIFVSVFVIVAGKFSRLFAL